MVLNLTTVAEAIMKRLFATVLALAVLALGSGARLLAHEGHEHKVMGTVTMAAADHVMLKDKDGKDVTVKVTKDTKVKAKPAIKVEDIKVGTRIVVTAVEEKDKSMTAKNIEVGAAPACHQVGAMTPTPEIRIAAGLSVVLSVARPEPRAANCSRTSS